jgi:hypothetical protein
MKLERLQEYVLPAVVTLGGMGFAIFVGYLMGQGKTVVVAGLFGLLFLGFLTLLLRQHIWMLIIPAWPWAGQIPILPIPFAVRDLAIIAIFCAFLALKALKVSRRKPVNGAADLVLLFLLLYLATVFVRNPVGTLASNSFRVGGKPYFNIAIACLAYWILARSSIAGIGGVRIVIFSFLGSNYAIGLLNVIAGLSPQMARVLVYFYSDLAAAADLETLPMQAQSTDAGAERLSYMVGVGLPSDLALISFFRPLTLVNPFYLGRCLCFGAATFLLLLSGFRTSIITTFGYLLLASYLRSGFQEIVRLAIIGLLGLTVLITAQGRLYHLPLSAQRALCFLPGQWNPVVVADAHGSTEWRLQMWPQMLSSNKYIQNRLLGDGFGITKRQLETITALNRYAAGGGSQESAMILGSVHSGPLTTVRVAGYVGLVLYLILLVMIARWAVILIRKAGKTPFLPLAFFIGLPLIYEPFNFVFVFGGFDGSMPITIFGLGMLKLLDNSLSDYAERSPETIGSASHRRMANPEYALAESA